MRTTLRLLPVLGLSLWLSACVSLDTASGKRGGARASDGRVTICHKGKRTMRVPGSAVRAHLRHGDTRGRCR